MTEPTAKAKPSLPTIGDVHDLPQDPAYPVGYDSAPNGPGGLVKSLGVASVIAFATSYNWATADYQKIANNWARNTVNHCAWAATIRDFLAELNADQKRSINLSCNTANIFTGGRLYVPLAYGYVAGVAQVLKGLSFPADFLNGEAGNNGGTSSEKGPADAKLMAFNSLISDVRQGIGTTPPVTESADNGNGLTKKVV